jgi:hypothetical protein
MANWTEVSEQDKLQLLEVYRRSRSVNTLRPYAEKLEMLPRTLMRRLQELDYVAPEYSGEVFPDKKKTYRDFGTSIEQIRTIQRYKEAKSISQDEAVWSPKPENPEEPIALVWMCDVHFGSLEVDYDLLEEDIATIKDTPNMYVAFGGDEINNFNAGKYPDGIWKDGISPEEQMVAWSDQLEQLDDLSKVAAMVWGNHTEFSNFAGINPYSAFFDQSVSCPIFVDGGGVLNCNVGDFTYRVGMRHTFWGGSKLNITNAAKKMILHGYPNLDVAMLGHTHYAAAEMFVNAGQEKIAIQGGTYKLYDGFRKRWDGNPHRGGFTILLYPDRKEMGLCRTPQAAARLMA